MKKIECDYCKRTIFIRQYNQRFCSRNCLVCWHQKYNPKHRLKKKLRNRKYYPERYIKSMQDYGKIYRENNQEFFSEYGKQYRIKANL